MSLFVFPQTSLVPATDQSGHYDRSSLARLQGTTALSQVTTLCHTAAGQWLFVFVFVLYPLTVQARSPGLSSLARLQGTTALSQVTTLCHTAAGQWLFVFVFVVISTHGSSTLSWAKLTGVATRNDRDISSYDTLSHCCRSVVIVCICFRGYIHSRFKHALLG